jgi:hypothetical protein
MSDEGKILGILPRRRKRTDAEKVNISANVIMLIALLVSVYSFLKVYTSYKLIFPGMTFDAILYTSGIVLAEVMAFFLVSQIHLLKKFNRRGDLFLSWFVIILVLSFELLCNVISHYAQMLNGVMDGVESFSTLFGIPLERAMVWMAWITGAMIPILGGINWKISTGLKEAMNLVQGAEEDESSKVVGDTGEFSSGPREHGSDRDKGGEDNRVSAGETGETGETGGTERTGETGEKGGEEDPPFQE